MTLMTSYFPYKVTFIITVNDCSSQLSINSLNCITYQLYAVTVFCSELCSLYNKNVIVHTACVYCSLLFQTELRGRTDWPPYRWRESMLRHDYCLILFPHLPGEGCLIII